MEKFDRNHPALALLQERYPLTKENSTKETWHVTLNIEGINLDFEPGDSLGICPQNDPILVEHLIEAMQAKASDRIIHKRTGKEISLKEFLMNHANLSRITSSFLQLIHEHENCSEIQTLLNPDCRGKMREFLAQHDPLFLLRDYSKNKLPLQDLCNQFGPLLPRFYSVASSLNCQKNAVDLTVALYTWTQDGEKRYGVASHFLCHLAEIGKTSIPIFVQKAHHFRLPKEHHINIVMIGPGTGIAPFRAFMQERMHHGSTAKHWLFFGERNRHSDFFYEEEWHEWENLRLHTAFSRDQSDKIYVQHKMLEHAKELYEWLQEGAHFYVCGDAKIMAKDVDKTLQQILSEQGKMTPEKAREKLKELKKEGRYLLDVY